MKLRVARTLKWNVIDKLSTQLLYALTGIILARTLSRSDFGLVGAILIFQSFATLFVDSGFSSALIQRKSPTRLDYSTVLWFNLAVAVALYAILFLCAPLIAWCFKDNQQLIPLSRVMFLSFIINASAIVQTNRLIKRMEMKMVAVSNSLGLFAGAIVGIYLAITGHGAWALVWQTLTLSAFKSAILWLTGSWMPIIGFSWSALKSYFKVGSGTMASAFLNVLFQNIYSFFIGNRLGMVPLGYYTQADKWSKMGISSLSNILTTSFLPALSDYQDSPSKFASATAKMNRFTAYLLFPSMVMLMAMATPLFHALFGAKWDGSIILFQLLLLRGIFVVLNAIYANYVLARGHARLIFHSEIIRDGLALAAIFITLPYLAITRPDNVTYGISIFLWGQVAAAVTAWIVMLIITSRLSWRTPMQFISDLIPYATQSLLIAVILTVLPNHISNPWWLILTQILSGLTIYLLINRLLGSKIQADVISYLLSGKNRHCRFKNEMRKQNRQNQSTDSSREGMP